MGKPFSQGPLIGINLIGVDSSAEPQFGALTRVRIYDASTTNGSRDAIYVKCGQQVTVSSALALGGVDGTVSVSAGGLVSLNAVTAAAGSWIWARTSTTGLA